MFKRLFPLALTFQALFIPFKSISFLDIPDGGKIKFDFSSPETLSMFSFYQPTQGIKPFNIDDKLYTWNLTEQKIILNDYQFQDIYASVKIGQITQGTWLQSGFYVQAKNITNSQDGIDGYNINIEKDADRDYYFLRLHRFDNGKWDGIIKEKIFYNENDEIELSLSIKNGILKTFVNNDVNYSLSYEIGNDTGKLGLRSYFSPMYFKDLTIVSSLFNKDLTELNNLLNDIRSLNEADYTIKSFTQLKMLYEQIINSDYDKENQIVIDRYVSQLQKLLNKLIEKLDYSALSQLIDECSSITNNNTYTKNSWKSFQYCLEKCKSLTTSSSEEEISYWGNMLISRKNELIRYGEKNEKETI